MGKILENLTFDETAQKRQEALTNRDAVRYYNLCNQAGIKPEVPDLYEQGAFEQEKLDGNNRITKRRARLKYPERYDDLLDYHNSNKVNIEQPTSDDITKMRRGLINIMGYIKLKIAKREKVLIGDAKPSRIIEVYRDCIIRAKSIQP